MCGPLLHLCLADIDYHIEPAIHMQRLTVLTVCYIPVFSMVDANVLGRSVTNQISPTAIFQPGLSPFVSWGTQYFLCVGSIVSLLQFVKCSSE